LFSSVSFLSNDIVLFFLNLYPHSRLQLFEGYMKHERPCLTTFPKTERRVENTTHTRVFLTNFVVIGNVVKHDLECLIAVLNRN